MPFSSINQKRLLNLNYKIEQFVSFILQHIKRKTEESQKQIRIFGIIFFINYPLYYLIWSYSSVQSYENLPIRISASLVCLPLILKDHWPKILKKYLPFYWHFAAMYCLPFFFIFMTIKNNASTAWLLNLILALLLIFLLFDFFTLCVLSILGGFLAWVSCFTLITTHFRFEPGTINLFGALATFLAAFVIGGIFARNREKIEAEKVEAIKMVASGVAHELRTPLAAISAYARGIAKFLPSLVSGYRAAEEAQLDIPSINQTQMSAIKRSAICIENEARASFHFIDMLLVNAKQYPNGQLLEACSIKECIQEALLRYPFQSNERDLICFKNQLDFRFKGAKLLIVHIFFNLIKNALYSIAASGKENGHIYIIIVSDGTKKVYFKDTGQGISKKILPRIFNKFYSHTYHGTGVGLAFCKMVMKEIGGDISCQSVEGEYAEFLLEFP